MMSDGDPAIVFAGFYYMAGIFTGIFVTFLAGFLLGFDKDKKEGEEENDTMVNE